MSFLLDWPFERKQYPGLGNPGFVSDWVAADQAQMQGAKALTGMGLSDFAIISGLDYILGIPNTYTAGIYYLNGLFYYQSASFDEGLYLEANVTTTLPEAFDDGNSRDIYTLYGSQTSVTGGAGFTPQFSGDMDAYRVGLKYTRDAIISLLATQALLEAPAFDPYGQLANTVCAGDDSRIVAMYNNVLLLDNTGVFVPSGDYNPATKKYADDHGGNILARGSYHIGDADSGSGTAVTIPIGATLGTTNYVPIFTIQSNSVNHNNDEFFCINLISGSRTTSTFQLWFREQSAVVQDVTIYFVIYAL